MVVIGGITMAILTALVILPHNIRCQVDGRRRLPGLDQITIVRDGKGAPYISANSLRDAILGPEFVIVQDRLFQIHRMRMKSSGRFTDLAGAVGRDLDIKTRTIGIKLVVIKTRDTGRTRRRWFGSPRSTRTRYES